MWHVKNLEIQAWVTNKPGNPEASTTEKSQISNNLFKKSLEFLDDLKNNNKKGWKSWLFLFKYKNPSALKERKKNLDLEKCM